MKNKLYSTREIALIALFVALITVCAWISIPLPPPLVPFTLQTFAVFAAAAILGTKGGITTIVVYCLLGIVGLPVFAGMKNGVGVLFGPTGGYLIGFLFTAAAIGTITKKFGRSVTVLAVSMIIGMLLYYVFGTAWFIVLYTRTKGAVSVMTALSWCVLPYIVPDLLKAATAILVVKSMEKAGVMRFIRA